MMTARIDVYSFGPDLKSASKAVPLVATCASATPLFFATGLGFGWFGKRMWRHQHDFEQLKQRLASEKQQLENDHASKVSQIENLSKNKSEIYNSHVSKTIDANAVWEVYRDSEPVENSLNQEVKNLKAKIDQNNEMCKNLAHKINAVRIIGNVSMLTSACILLGGGFLSLVNKK